jgi:hypothetical protein
MARRSSALGTAAAALLLCLSALLLTTTPANAYPQLWVNYQVDDEKLDASAPATCTGHPDHGEGAHGDPVSDDGTTFEITGADGKPLPATGACPGSNVTVTVAFPEARFLLASASAGALRGKTMSTLPRGVSQAACPNRWVHGMPGGQTAKLSKAPLTLTIPCAQEGEVELKVTSATGSSSPYLQGSSSVPVASTGCKPCKDKLAVVKAVAANATANGTAAAAAPAASSAARGEVSASLVLAAAAAFAAAL